MAVERAQEASVRVRRWLPARVWKHYLDHRGTLLAGGMTYSSLFSVFAGLWLGFSGLAAIGRGNGDGWDWLVEFIDTQVPGLIDDGSGGLVDASELSQTATGLTWTSLAAGIVLLFTAMGWMRAGQNGVRALFGLVGKRRGALLSQLFNLAALVLVALLVLAGALASTLTVTINRTLLAVFGITQSSVATTVSYHAAAGLVSLVIDFTLIVLFVYVLADVHPSHRVFLPRALAGALAISVLKIGGSLLIGHSGNNPLLASFALLIGFMLWLNIINQIFFVCVAWMAVADEGQDRPAPRPRPVDAP